MERIGGVTALGFWLLAATAQAAAPGGGYSRGPLGPAVQITFSSVFQDKTTPYAPIPWLAPPAAAEAGVPERDGVFAMADVRCASFSPTGRLQGCDKVSAEPAAQGYEAAALRVIGQLRVAPDYAAAGNQGVKWIDVQMRLSNSGAAEQRGPCWPPRCTFVLPPPPPPKTAGP